MTPARPDPTGDDAPHGDPARGGTPHENHARPDAGPIRRTRRPATKPARPAPAPSGAVAPGSRPVPWATGNQGDSAGQAWSGRHFDAHDTAYAGDDGAIDPRLAAALAAFARGTAPAGAVVEAVRVSRLLVPLLARAGDIGTAPDGHQVDKTQELSIVTLAAPDGRGVLPAFTSTQALQAWNPAARPVPASGPRVALAAASESTELIVLDPGSPTEFVLRRPAVWALAQGIRWEPSFASSDVARAFQATADAEPSVRALALAPGDPRSRFAGPELVVRLALAPGLTQEQLDGLLRRLTARWAADEVIAAGVDSMTVSLSAA